MSVRESRPSAPSIVLWQESWSAYETWHPVPGMPQYEVSDFGRVARVVGGGLRILKQSQNNNGYFKVCLGRKRQEYVHRLVALVFLGEAPDWASVDHYNFNKHDNRLQNLRYLDEAENKQRHYRHHLLELEQIEREILALSA